MEESDILSKSAQEVANAIKSDKDQLLTDLNATQSLKIHVDPHMIGNETRSVVHGLESNRPRRRMTSVEAEEPELYRGVLRAFETLQKARATIARIKSESLSQIRKTVDSHKPTD